jgi:urea transport system substrate-binding protein
MAISETPIKEVVLMAIDEINKGGGVLGRPVEPVIEDPASNWDLFAEKSKKLLLHDKVATVFGCWTSVSRKSMLPVFEQHDGLLFYPVQYEGTEFVRQTAHRVTALHEGPVLCEGPVDWVQQNPRVVEVYLGRGYHTDAQG